MSELTPKRYARTSCGGCQLGACPGHLLPDTGYLPILQARQRPPQEALNWLPQEEEPTARGEMTAERLAEIREWGPTVADLLAAYDAAQGELGLLRTIHQGCEHAEDHAQTTIQEQANELKAYAEAIARAEARIAALQSELGATNEAWAAAMSEGNGWRERAEQAEAAAAKMDDLAIAWSDEVDTIGAELAAVEQDNQILRDMQQEQNRMRERLHAKVVALEGALRWALDALGDPPEFTGGLADWEAAKALLTPATREER